MRSGSNYQLANKYNTTTKTISYLTPVISTAVCLEKSTKDNQQAFTLFVKNTSQTSCMHVLLPCYLQPVASQQLLVYLSLIKDLYDKTTANGQLERERAEKEATIDHPLTISSYYFLAMLTTLVLKILQLMKHQEMQATSRKHESNSLTTLCTTIAAMTAVETHEANTSGLKIASSVVIYYLLPAIYYPQLLFATKFP